MTDRRYQSNAFPPKATGMEMKRSSSSCPIQSKREVNSKSLEDLHIFFFEDYLIWFDFGNDVKQTIESIQHIDTKTILFQTPPCPYLPGNDDIKVGIHIQENHATPIVIDFDYMTRK